MFKEFWEKLRESAKAEEVSLPTEASKADKARVAAELGNIVARKNPDNRIIARDGTAEELLHALADPQGGEMGANFMFDGQVLEMFWKSETDVPSDWIRISLAGVAYGYFSDTDISLAQKYAAKMAPHELIGTLVEICGSKEAALSMIERFRLIPDFNQTLE